MPRWRNRRPPVARVRSNGLVPYAPAARTGRRSASGLRKMSAGPTNPRRARCTLRDRHLGREGRRRPLGVGQLLAGPDRPKRNVMGHDQPDGRFDLLGRGPEQAPIGGGRSDRSVHARDRSCDSSGQRLRPAGREFRRAASIARSVLPAVAPALAPRRWPRDRNRCGRTRRGWRRGPGCSRSSCRWRPIRARPKNWPRTAFSASRRSASRSRERPAARRRSGYSSASARSTAERRRRRPGPKRRRRCCRDGTARPWPARRPAAGRSCPDRKSIAY